MAQDLIYLNGVDGETGNYLAEPIELGQLAAIVKGEQPDERTIRWLQGLAHRLQEPHLGLPLCVDSTDVGQAGWGVVFHADEEPEVRDALAPLIDHRRREVGELAKVLDYRDGETRWSWLARHGVGAGTIEPDRVPFYLLLAGSPERIPFSFEFGIDIEYGVGRLHFDEVEAYRRYAESVVEYETSAAVPTVRRAVFFGTKHPGDGATEMSADQLVTPLASKAPKGFSTRAYVGEEATKERLAALLGGDEAGLAPAFCFTATHGVGWACGHPRQEAEQGALVCEGWLPYTPFEVGHYLSAADVSDEARPHGMIVFHFACYSAGTPERNSFLHVPGSAPPEIAKRPFVASLPRRLLAHPRGGALGVIGHVERAWGYSIVTPGAGKQLQPFLNAVEAIARGWPLGRAMQDFNERYAILSTDLSGLLETIGFGGSPPEKELARAWLERNDARNYVVLGDPAVRLRVDDLQQDP